MKLSIITINYNNKEGLQKTIDSVVCQTWRDFEWIVIDGGSTDGSKELIEKYQQHFAYWCSEPDKGVYNAMNKGIKHAKGEYLLFLNSGDVIFEASTLEKVFQKELIAKGDIVYGDCMTVENGTESLWTFPHRVDLEYFCYGNICHQGMFIKAYLLKNEGYDESYSLYADWARWIQLFIAGASFLYIPVVICGYEMGGMSSCNPEIGLKEYKKIVQLLPPDILQQILRKNDERRMRLSEFESSPEVLRTLALVKEHSLYRRLIKANLKFILFIKKFV